VRFAGGSASGERCELRFDARKYDPAGLQAFMDGFARFAAERCAVLDSPIWARASAL
jgi:hypothetical protein